MTSTAGYLVICLIFIALYEQIFIFLSVVQGIASYTPKYYTVNLFFVLFCCFLGVFSFLSYFREKKYWVLLSGMFPTVINPRDFSDCNQSKGAFYLIHLCLWCLRESANVTQHKMNKDNTVHEYLWLSPFKCCLNGYWHGSENVTVWTKICRHCVYVAHGQLVLISRRDRCRIIWS